VPIVYSLLGLVLFYALMTRLFDRGIARFASLLYATFPMFAYFGRNVTHEAPTLFYGLALITSYVQWRGGSAHRRWWAAAMVASIVVGGAYGWPMFLLAALLFGMDWLSRRRFDPRLFGLLATPAVLTLAAVLAQIAWFWGSLAELDAMFNYRRDVGASVNASLPEWFDRLVLYYAGHGFGKALIALLPLAVAFLAFRLYRERFSQRAMIVTVLGTWGLAHVLLFLQGAYMHLYWQFYLIPFVAAALAWPAVELTRRYVRPVPLRIGAFLVAGAIVYLMQHGRIVDFYANAIFAGQVVPVRTLWRTLIG
jgi:4-amino-4-deoxy-L-arabinose transferase-like glycosyltransferase